MALKGSLRGLLGTVAGAAVGGWFFHRMPVSALLSSWRQMHPAWLLCSLASCAAMLTVRSAKWRRLLVDSGHDRGTAQAVRSLLGSYTLGTLTPGRLGDLARCAFVSEPTRKIVLQLTLIDRLFDMIAVLTFAAASCVFLVSKLAGFAALSIWLGACIWVSRKGLLRLDNLAWCPQRFHQSLRNFAGTLRSVRHGRYAAWALAASLCDLLTLMFLLRAFHQPTLLAAFVAYPWLTLASGSPVSLGGLGPREGVSALIFTSFSISATAALNVSLLFFGFTLLIPSLAGGVWLLGGSVVAGLALIKQKTSLLLRAWESLLPTTGKILPGISRELD